MVAPKQILLEKGWNMVMSGSKKVVLITGASSGFGKVAAEYLSQKDYKVYGTSRNPSTQIKMYKMIQMNVNDKTSVAKGVRYILDKEGTIDVVVNNAGFGIAGSLEGTSVKEIKSQFETNFFGVLKVCKKVIPIMRSQQSGYIINISSIAGLIGVPFQGAYSASKFALEGLTEVLRMEVKPFGIHMVLIEPGDFNTEFTANRIKTKQSQDNSIYSERFKRALNIIEEDEKNGSKPDKIVLLIERIINNPSPRLRYMTGPLVQRIAVHLKKFLPARFFEWIITKSYKI